MRTLPLVLAITLLASPVSAAGAPAADAQVDTAAKPAARERADLGARHYAVAEYDEAIKEFKAAFLIDPRREYLWGLAQALRLKGDCATAIKTYESFIRHKPSPGATALAQGHIQTCQAQLDEQKAEAARAAEATKAAELELRQQQQRSSVEQQAPSPSLPPSASPRTPHPFYRDVLGNILLFTGLGAVAAGAGVLAVGNQRMGDAPSLPTKGAYDQAVPDAQLLQQVGVGLLASGGALAVGGLVRFLVLRAHNRKVEAAPTVSAIVAPGGGWVSLQTQF